MKKLHTQDLRSVVGGTDEVLSIYTTIAPYSSAMIAPGLTVSHTTNGAFRISSFSGNTTMICSGVAIKNSAVNVHTYSLTKTVDMTIGLVNSSILVEGTLSAIAEPELIPEIMPNLELTPS